MENVLKSNRLLPLQVLSVGIRVQVLFLVITEVYQHLLRHICILIIVFTYYLYIKDGKLKPNSVCTLNIFRSNL